MKILYISFILLILSYLSNAQSYSQDTMLVNGYAEKISGVDFNYHSSIAIAEECMLIRATNGSSSMEWKTGIVPEAASAKWIRFIWLAGLGSSPGLASFELEMNGKKLFTFWTDGKESFELISKDSMSLVFHKDYIDQHGDQFGFMQLIVPAEKLEKGKSARMKITGGKFDKTSWYMTFKFPIENHLNFKALPAVIEENGSFYQLGLMGILYFGDSTTGKLTLYGQEALDLPLGFGYNNIRVKLPRQEEKTAFPFRLEIDSMVWKGQLELQKVRNWRVNLVQHTHTDIGYTRTQTDILAEHLRFIDYALDYCDQTDHYSEDAKFRWTCEASWAVDEYLRSRPKKQIERLLARIDEGRIEVTGMYFNFSDLPDEQVLAASLKPLQLFRDKGIQVTTAMQNDVNGIGWSFVDYYNDLGVKYLNMGTHGHRALICFDRPTLFWWEAPSGNRMLAFRGEHYMIGNTKFKIHEQDFATFEENFLTYLVHLEEKNYPYDLIALQHSGYVGDNAPPSTFSSDIIEEWNKKYEWPKLRASLASEFFVEMEENFGQSFETIRGAWPDWWTDGFGSAAREVKATRIAQNDLIANTSGLCMASILGHDLPEGFSERIDAVNSALLFYTEHTVGYHASVREPFHEYTMTQRSIKESYAWEAARRAKMIGEETLGLLQQGFSKEKEPSILVFNTLNYERSGLCKVYIDYQIIPRNANYPILDKHGKEAKAQVVEAHTDGAYWKIWVDDIPAFGYKKFRIQNVEAKSDKNIETSDKDKNILIVENDFYRLEIDQIRGSIRSLYDLSLNMELIDREAEWQLGEFIYERPENREQMESFHLNFFTRKAPDSLYLADSEHTAIWQSYLFKGNTDAANEPGGFQVEIKLFHHSKRIDIEYFIDKKLITEPEGIYLAFPFHLSEGQLVFDVHGGEVRPGIDQIVGSSNDWNTVQNYARLYHESAQIVLSSQDVPLMQFGGINTGRYDENAKPESTHIYSWPMNNYWTTNFNADQHGGHRWNYSITSMAGNKRTDATKFGWNNRTPFLVRVMPGGGSANNLWENSLITGWPENILLISAIPEKDGKSAILHIRELEGKSGELLLRNNRNAQVLKTMAVDALGKPLEDAGSQIKPYASMFFRIWF